MGRSREDSSSQLGLPWQNRVLWATAGWVNRSISNNKRSCGHSKISWMEWMCPSFHSRTGFPHLGMGWGLLLSKAHFQLPTPSGMGWAYSPSRCWNPPLELHFANQTCFLNGPRGSQRHPFSYQKQTKQWQQSFSCPSVRPKVTNFKVTFYLEWF